MGRDIYCARLAPKLIWIGVNWNTAPDLGYEYVFDTTARRPHFIRWIFGWRCELKDEDDPIIILMRKLQDLEEATGIDYEEELKISTSNIDSYLLAEQNKMSKCFIPISDEEAEAAVDNCITEELENPHDGLFEPKFLLPLSSEILQKCELLLRLKPIRIT